MAHDWIEYTKTLTVEKKILKLTKIVNFIGPAPILSEFSENSLRLIFLKCLSVFKIMTVLSEAFCKINWSASGL